MDPEYGLQVCAHHSILAFVLLSPALGRTRLMVPWLDGQSNGWPHYRTKLLSYSINQGLPAIQAQYIAWYRSLDTGLHDFSKHRAGQRAIFDIGRLAHSKSSLDQIQSREILLHA